MTIDLPRRLCEHGAGLHTSVVVAIVFVLVLFAARTIGSFVIEYRWWQEMNQVLTWLNLMTNPFP